MTTALRNWLLGTPAQPTPEPPTIVQTSPPPSDDDDEDDGDDTEREDDDRAPAFPALNSAQRASPAKPASASASANSASTAASTAIPALLSPSADTRAMPPPPNPSLSARAPAGASLSVGSGLGGGLGAGAGAQRGAGTLMLPPSTTKAPAPRAKRREKVALAPGFGPLDWAALKGSGADLRGTGEPGMLRVTPSMLKEHRTKDDAWSAFGGKVYNVTAYLPYHPGGEKELMRVAGRDGTKLFMSTHAWVNADYMLDGCLVGFLVPEPSS